MTVERKFLLPWLWSAAVITVIRLLHATGLDYDAAIQIQAGHNLLAGKGLAIYWRASVRFLILAEDRGALRRQCTGRTNRQSVVIVGRTCPA